MDECRVYLPDKKFLKECEDKITEYKAQYHTSLQEEADQFEEAEKVLYRKSGIFKPKDLAVKMLEEPSIIRELSEKGKIQQGTVAAFFPSLKNNKDLGAVKWWVESNWNELKTGKKNGKNPNPVFLILTLLYAAKIPCANSWLIAIIARITIQYVK